MPVCGPLRRLRAAAREPLGDNQLYLTVVDGKVTEVTDQWAFGTNGFNDGMWQPFNSWIREEHARDVGSMYADGAMTTPRFDAESLRLWEKRVDEWVASQR